MCIYSVFTNKLPVSYEQVMPRDNRFLVTFLRPFYIEQLKDKASLYEKFDYICADGIYPVWLVNKLLGKGTTTRISFDMGSLAKHVFEYASQKGMPIFFVGAKEEDIKQAVGIIQQAYPLMKISGFNHGYIKNKFQEVIKRILDSDAKIVVIGMGAPMQDEFAVALSEAGFNGTIYTCGGFIEQTSSKINYYPNWINKYNLRAFYRISKNPRILKRLMYNIPFTYNFTRFVKFARNQTH